MQRGEIYFAELNPVMGCEFGGQQPVVIVQNGYGNRQGLTFIVAPIAKRSEARLPTQVEVTVLNKKAVVMAEQVRTLSGARFISSGGKLSDEDMAKVDQALKISVGLVKAKRTKAMDESLIHRGEIYFADLSHTFGSEQSGLRPVVIIQNDYGNRYSPTTIVAPITTKRKGRMPTHVDHWHHDTCETVLLEQVRAISCTRLVSRVGRMSRYDMAKIDIALKISLGLAPVERQPMEDTNPVPSEDCST